MSIVAPHSHLLRHPIFRTNSVSQSSTQEDAKALGGDLVARRSVLKTLLSGLNRIVIVRYSESYDLRKVENEREKGYKYE